MPEAPNNSPPSWASRGSSFSPSNPPTVGAPPLTDYVDLNTVYQGHTSTYPTAPTVFTDSPTRNNNHGGVNVQTENISWPSDGQAMYLAPQMPATTPGSLHNSTYDHPVTDIHQLPNNFILQSYMETFGNMTDAVEGVGSLNPGSCSIAWMEDIAEPKYVRRIERSPTQN